MLTIQKQPYEIYETFSYFERAYCHLPVTAAWKKYDPLRKKLEASYKALQPHLDEVLKKHEEFFRYMDFRATEGDTWVGYVLCSIVFLNEKQNKQEAFADDIMELLKAPDMNCEPGNQSHAFMQFLQNSEIDSQFKWELLYIYENVDFFCKEMQDIIETLQPAVTKELRHFESEVTTFVNDVRTQIRNIDLESYIKQVTHITLDDAIVRSVYPCVFASNSLAIQEHYLFLGILFDSSFDFQGENEQLDLLLAKMKVLTDPSKFAILKELHKESTYGNDLAKKMNLTPATISHHMNALVSEGFVNLKTGKSKRIYYSVNEDAVKRILQNIEEQLLS